MKTALIVTICLVAHTVSIHGQGWFQFNNFHAPTRIGSTNGPLAGSGIWAQMLVGPTSDSLAPVGTAVEHLAPGIGVVDGGFIQVQGIPPCSTAYLQMVAWDGTLWGQSLSAVPLQQLGMTDTVKLLLGGGNFPCEYIPIPFFRQPAVVPVPEPSSLAIAVMVGVGIILFCSLRGCLGRRSRA